jgi:hypothetical protein
MICLKIIYFFFFFLKNKYKLTIKDPSFLSQNQDYYQFYFGKVKVRPLVNCDNIHTLNLNNKKLCSIESSSRDYIPIGISSTIQTIPDAFSVGIKLRATFFFLQILYFLNNIIIFRHMFWSGFK